MKKPLASIHEFWAGQEVLGTHLGVLCSLGRPLVSPATRIREGLSVHLDSTPTNAAGQVGFSSLGLPCGLWGAGGLGGDELEHVNLGKLL